MNISCLHCFLVNVGTGSNEDMRYKTKLLCPLIMNLKTKTGDGIEGQQS